MNDRDAEGQTTNDQRSLRKSNEVELSEALRDKITVVLVKEPKCTDALITYKFSLSSLQHEFIILCILFVVNSVLVIIL